MGAQMTNRYVVGPDINSGYVVQKIDAVGNVTIVAYRNYRDNAEMLAQELRHEESQRAPKQLALFTDSADQ